MAARRRRGEMSFVEWLEQLVSSNKKGKKRNFTYTPRTVTDVKRAVKHVMKDYPEIITNETVQSGGRTSR